MTVGGASPAFLQDQELGLGRKAQWGSTGVWAGERHSVEARRLQPPLICILSDWFSLLVPH